MPEIINCPQCERKLRVPEDLLGKSVKCPTCGTTFTASAASAAPAPLPEAVPAAPVGQESYPHEEAPQFREDRHDEEGEYDDELRYGRTEESEGWQKVRTGVGLILAALFVQFGTGLVGGCAGAAGRQGARDLMLMAAGLNVLGILVGQVLNVIGNFFCLAVPPRGNARTLAIVSLVLLLTNLVLSLIVNVMTFGGAGRNFGGFPMGLPGGVIGMIAILSGVLGLGQMFVFLSFLRAVANGVGARALARSIQSLNTLLAVALVLLVAVAAIVVAVMPMGGVGNRGGVQALDLMMVFGCIGGLALLAIGIWYIVVLIQVRAAIANQWLRGRA